MNEKTKILYIGNDANYIQSVKPFIPQEFNILLEINENKIWNIFQKTTFHIIMIDVLNVDGFKLIELIRKKNQRIPIVMFYSPTIELDIIKGFKSGADDCISKTISIDLVIAKIKAIVRKYLAYTIELEINTPFQLSDYTTFNNVTRIIKIDKKEIKLTTLEAKLLYLLATELNQCVKKECLTNALWQDSGPDKNAYLDKYLVKIRKHLSTDPTISIVNIRGEGFCLANKLQNNTIP